MCQMTIEHGSFTVQDIQNCASAPRSTSQDWISRLYKEGCIVQVAPPHGRAPARYASRSVLPSTACRRIFTCVDGDRIEIFHDCMSSACAAFCAYHHRLAKGPLIGVERDGTTLRECAQAGSFDDVAIGLHPLPAVGITGIWCDGEDVIQRIRCTGGPAYSLTDMMAQAEGVLEVIIEHAGSIVEGTIRTRGLLHLAIGVDDTDSEEGGATFALALALLQYISSIPTCYPIGHHVAMLFSGVPYKTGGNSCSRIDIAIEPSRLIEIQNKIVQFVSDASLSDSWGIAIKTGFLLTDELKEYGRQVRNGIVTDSYARSLADAQHIFTYGRRGIIGALGAVALSDLDHDILLNPTISSW